MLYEVITHPAATGEEGLEQAELEGRQHDLGLVDPDAVAVAIEAQAAKAQRRRLRCPRVALGE